MAAFGRQLALTRTSGVCQIATGSPVAPGPTFRVWDFGNNRWLRRTLRAARIGALSVSIFGVGYSTGASDVLADPTEFRRKKALSLLKNIHAFDAEGKARLCEETSEEVQAVRRVLPRVLKAARAQVGILQEEIQDAIKQQGEASYTQQQDLDSLKRARKRLESWSDDGFLLADVNTPNAFVTPMLPRTIFVHRGIFRIHRLAEPEALHAGAEVFVLQDGWKKAKLVSESQEQWSALLGDSLGEDSETITVKKEDVRILQTRNLVENDEQLAMLLSHELAHAVHDHGYESLNILTTAYSLELVLLSVLDPTGMLEFLLEIAAGAIARYAFVLPLGRCDKMEADATGLKICALAGYDPRLATKFLDRFALFEGYTGPTWTSTHPATEARIKALKDAEADAVERFQQHKEKQAP